MSAASGASWNFAPTGGGIIHGYNNASMEHFKQDPIGKLVRETVQNSLDAHQDGLEQVIVDIRECDIDTADIGSESLELHIQQSLKWVRSRGQEEGVKAYQKSLAILNKPTIPCLAIIDHNTTGLQERKWDSLIYEEGVPEKDGPGAHGGSFGIGKNAPYNVSSLRTVIYSTRYTGAKTGRVEKMTGRTQLVSHPSPNNGELLQHIGFYGRENGSPLCLTEIPSPFRLDETGTALWVTGFQPEQPNWQKAAILAAVDNFFYAIHHRKLVVNVYARVAAEPVQVCCDTIDSILEEFRSPKHKTTHYYRAIRNGPVATTEAVGSIGPLSVFINSEKNAPSRVAYVNRRGMLITDSRERRRSNPFYPGGGQGAWPDYGAVVTAMDDATDKYIRRMENPAHDIIAVDRLPESEQETAREHLRQVGGQIRDIIERAIREQDRAAASNITELSRLFPDIDPSLPENLELNSRTVEQRIPPHKVTTVDDASDLTEEDLIPDESGDFVIAPDFPDLPDGPGPGPGPGPRPTPDVPASPRDNKPANSTIDEVVIMRTGRGELSVAFSVNPEAGAKTSFSIEPGGEESLREGRIQIASVKQVTPSNAQVEFSNGVITVTKPKAHKGLIILALDIGENSAYTGYKFSERQSPEETTATQHRVGEIRKLLATNATQTEIAKALGISRQRVSQLIKKYNLRGRKGR